MRSWDITLAGRSLLRFNFAKHYTIIILYYLFVYYIFTFNFLLGRLGDVLLGFCGSPFCIPAGQLVILTITICKMFISNCHSS